VAASVASAGGDQFLAAVAHADCEHLDVFADDGAGAREAGVVEGVLERCELLVLVVAIDGDLRSGDPSARQLLV